MPKEWSTSRELLLAIDRTAPTPLRQQVEEGLRRGIGEGRLPPGTPLPSTRALAIDLSVARGVVVDAYEQLIAEGYLIARRGAGTAVAEGVRRAADRSAQPAMGAEPAPDQPARVRYDFRPGLPDLAAFPRAAWLRATRTALNRLPDADLAYGDPRGLPILRRALAGYLGRVRGVLADPERVVVTNGFSQGLALLVHALAARGAGRIGVEDPGHPGPRNLVRVHGATVCPVPVDAAGVRIDVAGDMDALVVTPAHQFPTGVVMSPRRRGAVVDWARNTGGWVIEDDYDAEYRFDREPLGAVQGLDPDRVVYAGSVSKSLVPALRLGWLVLPAALVDAVLAVRQATDLATAAPVQAAFAELLASGGLDRHLRRTRRIYRHRRDTLAAALARHAPRLRLAGIPAGLHAVATLPSGADEEEVARRAEAASVRVYPMSGYRVVPPPVPSPALVLGYASLSPAEIDAGVRRLSASLRG
jgi:GntR family transcriptional regulator / MocR family aminotransferase